MYDKNKANNKTAVESVENLITVCSAIVAAKIGNEMGINLTGEQLLIIGAGIKVLIARIRNRIKHRKSKSKVEE